MKKTSTFQNALIWFGAGVSLAEILTGTAFAPLGMGKGLLAILIGHVIGCGMMLLAGLIGGRTGRSAMETVKMSFGQKGGLLFALLNVLQLVGWTAIMIYDGALAIGGIFDVGRWVWCLVIGALILLWIVVGITDLGWINKITMAALFVLTLVLCKVIFFSGSAMAAPSGEGLTFGAAVELAVAMPLSWLPLISDYTRQAQKPVRATAASVVTYGLVSCWMYVIGMGAAIFTGEYDIAVIMVKAGLGIAALVILVFSPVQEGQRQDGGHHHHCGGRGRGHPVPHGRYHRLSVPDRLRVRPHDRRADCRPLPAAPGPLRRGRRRPEPGDLAHGLCGLSPADGGGHPRGLHPAGHGPDHPSVRHRGEAEALREAVTPQ